jgi:type IV fimbrial biogenesis protein FimT
MDSWAVRRQCGVTMVEVMVSLALIAIVGSIALPNFIGLQRGAQRTVVVNDLIHTVFYARNEAIKRNSVVSVCRSIDGTTCANKAADWNAGWLVFENLNHDQPADLDPGEPILLRHGPISFGSLTSNRVSFSFRAYAQADANGTFVFCPTKGVAKDARAVIVSHTGRPRASNRDSSNKALKC